MSFLRPDDDGNFTWTGIPPGWEPEPKVAINDHAFEAFILYAHRERALDEAQRAPLLYGQTDESRREVVDWYREANRRVLFRESSRSVGA